MSLTFLFISVAVGSYLFGCLPSALIIVKIFTGEDVRSGGSKNIGALNALRVVTKFRGLPLGLIAFLIVIILDFGKAVAVTLLAQKLIPMYAEFAFIIAAFFVILGHNYPIFLKFKGGRGAACLLGILLYYNIAAFWAWIGTVALFSILLEVIDKKKFNIKVIIGGASNQILGRLVGEVVALLPVYLLHPTSALFASLLVTTPLVLIRHAERLRQQLSKSQNIR